MIIKKKQVEDGVFKVRADEEARKIFNEYEKVRAEFKILEKKEKELKKKVMELLDTPGKYYINKKYYVVQEIERKNMDKQAVADIYGVDWEDNRIYKLSRYKKLEIKI